MMNNKKRRRELIFLISLLTLCASTQAQKRPPNYSQDDMPITSFTCHNRIVGGYYADPETDCQMFHVCVNVPGIGIQDYRFLCPNDTTFDQEHQICDDWYNIDCELALYESFDLYRIGAENEIKKPTVPKKVANKATPIPLGPSSTVKPFNAAAPKKNVYTAVNNGISEDDDYFKRTGNTAFDESKVPDDILRGSHSSNFYDSKTRGRDDLEDDYHGTNVEPKHQNVNAIPDVKKHKTLVRKLASRRPVSQKPVQQGNAALNYNVAQPAQQYNRTETNPRSQNNFRGNVNYNSFPKTSQDDLYQKINNLTEDASQKKDDKNIKNGSTRSQSKFRPTSKFSTTTVTVPVTNAEVRLPSTEYLRNIASNYQQPATLINNQLQDNSRNSPAYDYSYKQFKQPASSVQPAYPNYQTGSQNYFYETTPSYEQTKTTEYRSFYQPNTTVFDYYKYYQTSTTNYQQNAKNYYASTTTNVPKYDPYNSFQKSSEKYEDGETLNTAHSSNLKPSDLNAIYNQQKLNVNATLKAAFNVEPFKANYYNTKSYTVTSPSPASTTQNYYQPFSSARTNQAVASSTPPQVVNYRQSVATSSPQNYYSVTTNVPQKHDPVPTAVPNFYYQPSSSTLKPIKPNPTVGNVSKKPTDQKASNDYDYAYYDNAGGSSEYDNIENLEDFKKVKHS